MVLASAVEQVQHGVDRQTDLDQLLQLVAGQQDTFSD
jgi:hypothetical protein